MLIDTHCHIHWSDFPLPIDEVISNSHINGVNQMICIGTDAADSKLAIDFASQHEGVYATIGVHPHYAKNGLDGMDVLLEKNYDKIVAIGEIGLDYFYKHSSHEDQIKMLRIQIKLALRYNLPIIFHVRDAFDDFWPVFDEFTGIRGVLHSFTDTAENMQAGLDRGLYIGVNGYSTFTKDEAQKSMFASIPLSRIILETDAPFLTPIPFRGKVNIPAYVKNIAEYHGVVRHIGFDVISSTTTANARDLFNL
ncbi:MAG: TatD family hydrolase [Candidatus Saccharibacteria bacterium]